MPEKNGRRPDGYEVRGYLTVPVGFDPEKAAALSEILALLAKQDTRWLVTLCGYLERQLGEPRG